MFKNSKLLISLAEKCLKSNNTLNQFTNKTIKLSFSLGVNVHEKKKGQYVDIANSDVEKPRKVKLYPGFQISTEEIHQKLAEENFSQDVYAKKVIEDFYGLNELEYEKEEPVKDVNEELLDDDNKEFNLEKAIKILNSENVQDICCIQIPKEINYADYMIIGNCLSDKHLNSVFLIINRKYKLLKQETDNYLIRKSGKESKWCAIDTGRIVIHLFLSEYRDYYDLETLWTCGSEFDEKVLEYKDERSELERKFTILEVDESKI